MAELFKSESHIMKRFDLRFTGVTLVASLSASIAAVATAALGWPVWAMFIGWVAFATGQKTATGASQSYLCVVAGIAIGNLAAIGLSQLAPIMSFYSLAPVVFTVALVVLTLRAAPFVNVIPAYWLGLIAFFAAHSPPNIYAFVVMSTVCALGVAVAFAVHVAQSKIAEI